MQKVHFSVASIGHSHQENLIEVGYLLRAETLRFSEDILNTNISIPENSSVRALFDRKADSMTFTTLIRSFASLGGQLYHAGYKVVPSPGYQFPLPNQRYFFGGYSVRTYGSANGGQVDAIQLELPRSLRVEEDTDQIIGDLADCLTWFVKEYYL